MTFTQFLTSLIPFLMLFLGNLEGFLDPSSPFLRGRPTWGGVPLNSDAAASVLERERQIGSSIDFRVIYHRRCCGDLFSSDAIISASLSLSRRGDQASLEFRTTHARWHVRSGILPNSNQPSYDSSPSIRRSRLSAKRLPPSLL